MTERKQRYTGPSENCAALEPEITICAEACARLEELVNLFEAGHPSTWQSSVKRDYIARCVAYHRAKVMLNRKSATLTRSGMRESVALERESKRRQAIRAHRKVAAQRAAAPISEPGSLAQKTQPLRWAARPVVAIEVPRMKRLGGA